VPGQSVCCERTEGFCGLDLRFPDWSRSLAAVNSSHACVQGPQLLLQCRASLDTHGRAVFAFCVCACRRCRCC
jgi:hypothetical protein